MYTNAKLTGYQKFVKPAQTLINKWDAMIFQISTQYDNQGQFDKNWIEFQQKLKQAEGDDGENDGIAKQKSTDFIQRPESKKLDFGERSKIESGRVALKKQMINMRRENTGNKSAAVKMDLGG